jgi:hypothetical protein
MKFSTLPLELHAPEEATPPLKLAQEATVLTGFARPSDRQLLAAIESVMRISPLRHMETRGGRTMSIA